MEAWATYLKGTGDNLKIGPPFASSQNMYDKIDSTEVGDISWQVYVCQPNTSFDCFKLYY